MRGAEVKTDYTVRRALDRLTKSERIVVHEGDRHVITVRVVGPTGPWRDRKGRKLDTPRAIKRALAHGRAGYLGELACRICGYRGSRPDCAFCVRGIARYACGDCHEVLPGCACVMRACGSRGAA